MICEICFKEFDKERYSGCYSHICSSKCFDTRFWIDYITMYKKHPKEHAIINGVAYTIGDEYEPTFFRGFGGRKYTIKYFNGDVVETTNLWYNGEVPENFRSELKDDAIFMR